MAKVTYTFSFAVNAEASDAGILEAKDLKTELYIPDGYSEDELRYIIQEMEAELPYFQYRNTLVRRKNIEVEYISVSEFSVRGDNIGEAQRDAIVRAFQVVNADIAIARKKQARKQRIENVITATKDIFKKIRDFFIKPKPEPEPEPVELKPSRVAEIMQERKTPDAELSELLERRNRMHEKIESVDALIKENAELFKKLNERLVREVSRDDTGVWGR